MSVQFSSVRNKMYIPLSPEPESSPCASKSCAVCTFLRK